MSRVTELLNQHKDSTCALFRTFPGNQKAHYYAKTEMFNVPLYVFPNRLSSNTQLILNFMILVEDLFKSK